METPAARALGITMETWANGLPLSRSPSLSGSDDFHRAACHTPNSSTSWEVVSTLEFEMPLLVNQSPDDPNTFWLGDGARDGSSSMDGEVVANRSSVSVVEHASFLLGAEAAQPFSPTDCCSAAEAGAALDEAISAHHASASAKASNNDGPLVGSSEATGQNRFAKMFYSCPGQFPPDGSSDASCAAYANSTPSISGHHAMLGVAATVEITSLRAFLGEEVPAFPFAVAAAQHASCNRSAELVA